MRKALALALLLAFPPVALAGKGLIITPPNSSWQIGDSFQLASLKTELIRAGQREGYEFFVRGAHLVPTLHARRGVFYDSPNDSTRVDWLWVIGHSPNRFGTFGATYDSLTVVGSSGNGQRTFALVPTVFSSRMSGTKGFCSTGPPDSCAGTNAGPTCPAFVEAAPGTDTLLTGYSVGRSERWKIKTPSYQRRGTLKAGQWIRQLVCLGFSTKQGIVTDNDAIVTNAGNDSMVVWEYAVAVPGTAISDGAGSSIVAAVLCMTEGTSAGASDGDPGTMFQTLARLDSLSLGKVFERRVANPNTDFVPGLPIQASALILQGYQTGGETFFSSAAFQGIRRGSLTYSMAQADSIDGLSCKPTLMCEWDSVYVNAWQDQVWSRIRDLHYCAGGEVGRTGETSLGNSTASRPMDPIGRSRARFAFGDKSGAGADTSVHGNLKNVAAAMRYRFGSGKFERALAFSATWAPTSTNAMTDDSLYAAVAEEFHTWIIDGFVGTYGPTSGQLINWPRRYTTRYGFSPDSASGVRALSTYSGARLRFILQGPTSSIGADHEANGQNSVDVAKSYGSTYVALLTLGRQFIHASASSNIASELPANVTAVTAGGMGQSDVPPGIAGQWSFRVLKQVANVMAYANASCWPANRPLFEWVYPSELR